MRDDYKKQLNDYKNDYTDDDINDRLETIKILEHNTTMKLKKCWELKYQIKLEIPSME